MTINFKRLSAAYTYQRHTKGDKFVNHDYTNLYYNTLLDSCKYIKMPCDRMINAYVFPITSSL